MTLEPDNNESVKFQAKERFSRSRKQRQKAVKRSHLRELEALEFKVEHGLDMSQTERGRLTVLREFYR